jgi:hypothetical protein
MLIQIERQQTKIRGRRVNSQPSDVLPRRREDEQPECITDT